MPHADPDAGADSATAPPSDTPPPASPPEASPPSATSALLRTGIVGLATLVGAGLEWIPDDPSTWSWLPLGVAYVAGFGPILRDAGAALRKGRLSIDALMGIAAVGAAVVGQPLEGAILIFLFTLSGGLEDLALRRTRTAVTSLLDLRPETAIPLDPEGEELPPTPVSELDVGTCIRVRPGERIAADGRVADGTADVDQSAITGEALPVRKAPGDDVFAATVVSGGTLVVEVTRPASDTLVARIIRLVEEARENRAPAQAFIDRFAHPYTLAVVAATALVALVPPLLGWMSASDAFYRAMTLLVVASPCALVISTPAGVLSAIAGGARRGILFKGGGILDRAGEVDAVAFDKTGTLTEGRPLLLAGTTTGSPAPPDPPRPSPASRSEPDPAAPMPKGVATDIPADILRTAAALEAHSEHHLARAILTAAEDRGLQVQAVDHFRAIPGEGVAGHLPSSDPHGSQGAAWIGNEVLARRMGTELPGALLTWRDEQAALGRSVVFCGGAPGGPGALAFGDRARPEAAEAVAGLRADGIRRIVVLSGDHRPAVEAVARELGIHEVQADLLPDRKVEAVAALAREHRAVAMVGDGVNDAPAMAAASLGIAMGGAGTDVAIETADVVLMGDRVTGVRDALRMARNARRIVRQNVWFSVGWMALLVGVTATVGLPLTLAVVAHEGSTLLVVLNGLRLLRG
ncbi:MAG: HAD family hydrolase [Gemmatimonadales bacterium]|nr:MAG: HAD family hydrolase [Gemmatimonadales bacterium]